MTSSSIQGVSDLTVRKELEIGGIMSMRFNQFKSPVVGGRGIKRLLVADIFSGDGLNVHPDFGNIDGSPLKIAKSYRQACLHGKALPCTRLQSLKAEFWFSDIRPEAVTRCRELVGQIGGPFHKQEFFASSAVDALAKIEEWLRMNRDGYAIVIVDPNGPKQFPYMELLALSRFHAKRMDIIPNISATSIKRCLGAYRGGHLGTADWWIREIPGFDAKFIRGLACNKRKAWIRMPVAGDSQQWFMLPSYGFMPPRNDWNSQGYVEIDSPQGKNAIAYYTSRRD